MLFCGLLLVMFKVPPRVFPIAAEAYPYPAKEDGYINGNYSIFSYHLPESEDEFEDVLEDGKDFTGDDSKDYSSGVIFNGNNDSIAWDDDGEVTEAPFSQPDHVGDELEHAEILPDDGDYGYDDIDSDENQDDDEEEDVDDDYDDETNKDVVQKFLEQVEVFERNKANCTAGTHHNLGKGVIKQYGLNRFKAQALVAVNRANFLTRIWKQASPSILTSEYFFYTQVRSMVEGDPEIFAGGNCYDKGEFKDYRLFCPYAYRTKDGINVKDLSVEYPYGDGNSSEWFYTLRQRASNIRNFTITYGTSSLCCSFTRPHAKAVYRLAGTHA